MSQPPAVRLSCQAVLFDLDGVLVDSTRFVSRQWKRWAQENNLNADEVIQFAHGRRTVETVQLLMPNLDAAAEAAKLEEREAADTDGVSVMPGALRLLSAIPPAHWSVVTSGTRGLALARLKLGGLPLPEVLVTADDVANGKPHPEPYLKGAELLGIAPPRCLVIEDAPAGIQAARAAHMRAIAVTGTYSPSQLQEADLVVTSLAHVTARWDEGEALIEIRVVENTEKVP